MWIDIIPISVASAISGESEKSLRLRIKAEHPKWARKNNKGWYEIDRPMFIEWVRVRYGY